MKLNRPSRAREVAEADLMWTIALAAARCTPERAVVRAFVRAAEQDTVGSAAAASARGTGIHWS